MLAAARIPDRSPEVDHAGAPVAGEEVLGGAVETVHAEVGGDPVGDLVAGAVVVGGEAQQVDEAWGDDQAGGVDLVLALQRRGGHGGDRGTVDADVGGGVERRLRVDDPPAAYDRVVDVVGARLGRGTCEGGHVGAAGRSGGVGGCRARARRCGARRGALAATSTGEGLPPQHAGADDRRPTEADQDAATRVRARRDGGVGRQQGVGAGGQTGRPRGPAHTVGRCPGPGRPARWWRSGGTRGLIRFGPTVAQPVGWLVIAGAHDGSRYRSGSSTFCSRSAAPPPRRSAVTCRWPPRRRRATPVRVGLS